MSFRFASSRAVVLAGVIAALQAGAAAEARGDPEVTGIRIGLHADKVRVVLDASAKIPVRSFELVNPYRVVLDLPEVDWRIGATDGETGLGPITGYRFGQFAPGRARVVFDLTEPRIVDRVFHLEPTAGRPWRLVVDLKAATSEAIAARMTQPLPPPPVAGGQPAAIPVPRPDRAPSKRVVAIDPGHGGVDPGAIGPRGVHEKTIVLAMARQLKEALEKNGRYRVVLTRDRDTFLRLRERVAIARAANADLFISLHADSIRERTVHGASVYTLSERASDKEAADLAARENRADLIAGIDLSAESDEVANILIDLAQRETMNHSARLARSLMEEMRKVTRFLPKAHRFAGFAVLKAPDVPSVLIELGYLSNSNDVGRLMRPRHRARLAAAIARGIDAYFASRPQAAGR